MFQRPRLPSASWRIRKVGGKTQFRSKGLRISGLMVVPDDRKGKINSFFLNVYLWIFNLTHKKVQTKLYGDAVFTFQIAKYQKFDNYW